MKNINWFAIAAVLFLLVTIIVTLWPGEQPREYINTPIGLAIVSSIFSIRHEIVLGRREVSKSNIITENLLKQK